MGSSIQYSFLLILRDASELAANTVNKNPIISKVFLKKVLKFYPCY